ncbi:hypothetical protein [Parasitella parasitica]|uniref:DUF6818 domain-containing protein n=1 Tax=Parasitella parasitica TaxID=35722 RepID=A0A0B7NTA7_9FUNG|nr:hypothetical protein [Parasitella parasitica]
MARLNNTKNFTKADKLALAKLLIAFAPLGHDEWEIVTQSYNTRLGYEDPISTLKLLKNKWRSMRLIKKPTGNAI